MKTTVELVKESGLWDAIGNPKELEKLIALVREDERKDCAARTSPVNDEIIAELWHKAGGHLHRFARLLEQFMVKL